MASVILKEEIRLKKGGFMEGGAKWRASAVCAESSPFSASVLQ